jgi:translation initiation factor 2 alpha subunit (eIF-2alpha)
MKFYENNFPEDGTIVAVRVDEINDFGVNVTLLEYDLKGMVMAKEVSRKRIRTIKEVLRVGQETAAQVTKSDEKTACVDLSIKLCSAEEIATTLNRYHKHGAIFNILNKLAEQTGSKVEDHLSSLVWPKFVEDIDVNIYDLFVNLNNPTLECWIDADFPYKSQLLDLIRAKLPKPSFSSTQTVKLVCKNALKAPELLTLALNSAASIRDVSVWIIAPPEYKFTASGDSQKAADETLAAAVSAAHAALA